MTGVAFWRRKRRLGYYRLQEKCGISVQTLKLLEEDRSETRSMEVYLRLATALEVSVDELLREYDESQLSMGDQRTRKNATSAGNCIGVFRRCENLTLTQLASLLGVGSRECARRLCISAEPMERHIATLAAYLNMEPEAFRAKYALEEGV